MNDNIGLQWDNFLKPITMLYKYLEWGLGVLFHMRETLATTSPNLILKPLSGT